MTITKNYKIPVKVISTDSLDSYNSFPIIKKIKYNKKYNTKESFNT